MAETAPPSPAPPRPPGRHLTLPVALFLGLGVLAVVGLLLAAAHHQDQAAARHSVEMGRTALKNGRGELRRLVQEYAERHDPGPAAFRGWAERMLGPARQGNFTIDAAARVGPDGGRTVARLTDKGPAALSGGVGALVERARTLGETATAGILKRGGTPFTAAAARMAESDTVLILGRDLDAGQRAVLSARSGIDGIKWRRAPPADGDQVVLPLATVAGGTAGYLVWTPRAPGHTLLVRFLPPIAGVMLVMAGLAALIVHRSGRMAREARNAADAVTHMRDQLFDAVESLSEGFVLFDQDHRLVVCNTRYREAYPGLADALEPGVRFEDLLRIAAGRTTPADAVHDLGEWVESRRWRHLDNTHPVDRQLSNGRWYRISEHPTRAGGIVKVLMDITELKENEQRLAETSSLLRTTLENISQGLAVFDTDDRLVAWNANFRELLDVPQSLATTGVSLERFRRLEHERLGTREGLFPADGETEARETEVRLSGGRALSVFRRPLPRGGLVATYTDITARKHYESVLEEVSRTVSGTTGTAFFRSLVDSLARALGVEMALVGELNGDGTVTTLAVTHDSGFRDNFTYALSETPCSRVLADRVCLVPENVQGHFPHDGDLHVLGAESYLGEALYDSNDQPLGVVAVMSRRRLGNANTALSLLHIFATRAAAELERVRTETALKQSEQQFRELVEFAPFGIVLWDGDRIQFANAATARILGVADADAALGRALADHLDERLATLARGVLKGEAAAAGDLEGRVVPVEGETRAVEMGVTAFRHHERMVALVVLNDVTARKQAEQALQHAQKMEAVGQLAGGIAHEFNNMLTAIGGFARMAERDPENPDRVRTCLGQITGAADRAASLTQQLLTFSRRRASEGVQTVRLGDLAVEMKTFLRPVLGETVTLALDVRDDAVAVRVDPAMLNQAVVNLAINGRDAMPEGGEITLVIDSADAATLQDRFPGLPDGRLGVISVMDTGSGIDPAELDRIFEPFYTTKDPGSGTGLGLPMVYGTAVQVDGTVDVTSTPGEGTTFTLYLPAVPEAEAAGEAAAEEGVPDGSGLGTVLVAEDEDSVRELARMALAERGFTVITATDGVEALNRHREWSHDIRLLVTDLVMPHLDGRDLARVMLEERSDLKVIYMSGYTADEDTNSLGRQPGCRMLHKPVDPEHLAREAVRLLQAAG